MGKASPERVSEGGPASQDLLIRRVPFTDSDAQRLVDRVQDEYRILYGAPDETPLEEGIFEPPRGAFFVAYAGGAPAAMGGWRLRDDVHPLGRSSAAEIKRMYVARGARRRGYARTVLRHLEDTARDAGADVMVLETGTAQPDAIALYTSQGYTLVENFGYYAWSPSCRSFAKPL